MCGRSLHGNREVYRIDLASLDKWRIIDRLGNVVDKGLADEAAALARLTEIKAEKKRAA
jgi:hypothetical protein